MRIDVAVEWLTHHWEMRSAEQFAVTHRRNMASTCLSSPSHFQHFERRRINKFDTSTGGDADAAVGGPKQTLALIDLQIILKVTPKFCTLD